MKLADSPKLFRSRAAGAVSIATTVLLAHIGVSQVAVAKPFEEYIKPMPPVAPLSSDSWGEAALPRDLSNGIESAKGAGVHPEYYYWDGQIIKAKDGKYHMFMSTFSGNTNFGTSWQGSDAFHAISDTNVLGPYKRQDYVYSSHKGHNVSAAELPDGTYAVIVSEIVPFQIFKSSSLDGPWTGCSPQSDIGSSNISFFPRHDGKFQITERHGTIAIADTLCGAYKKQKPTCSYTQTSDAADSVYPKRTSIPGVSNPQFTWQEDPHIWRSGGTYHIIYSGSGDRVGWHVYSPDGLAWKDNGYAWSPRDYKKIFCYEGSTTCNAWYKMERPGVVLQDGHPTHITWAVSDVDKDNQVTPGTNHGTKVVVVPFDGVAFDTDFGDGSTGGSGGNTGGGGATGKGGAGGTTTRPDGGSAGSGGSTSPGGASGTGTGGSAGGGGPDAGGGGATSSKSGGSSGTATGGSGTGGTVSGTGGATHTSGGAGGSGGVTDASGGAAGSGSGGKGGTAGSGGNVGSGGTSVPPVQETSSGCSCQVGGNGNGAFGTLWLLGLAAAVLRLRRRLA
jgi:MYXO-CTERM domain-containing protein